MHRRLPSTSKRIVSFTLALSFGFVAPLFAQDGSNVLLVVNKGSSVSEVIGARYADMRHVPADNLLRLMTATDDEIDRARFEREIERPISDWISRRAAQDRILYVVNSGSSTVSKIRLPATAAPAGPRGKGDKR